MIYLAVNRVALDPAFGHLQLVPLFERSTAGFAWLKENLKPGDLVHVRGRIGESNYEKDGQTVYDTSLTADRFAVVPVGKDG